MALLRLMILLTIFCICFLRPIYSQEFVITPTTVILFPGETSAQFFCQVNPSLVTVSWEVDGMRYGLDQIFGGELPGHNVSGSNLTVSSPMNGTKYVCLIPATPPVLPIFSDPAFLYIAGAPDSVLSVTIDPLTVSINRTNNIVNFTLEWDEPFDNFDLILNYTVIITCTNVTGCPVTFTTNITRLDVSLMTNLAMMNHSIAITANNSIGGSDPTTRFIILPGIDMVNLICTPVDIENECTVMWNATVFGNDIIEASITYNVYYFGDNITSGSLGPIDSTMAVIRNLPANNSDVNVNVTAINVFGSGRNGTASDTIMARSVIGTTSTILNPDVMASNYSAVVLCEIDPTSTADYCRVFARDGTTTVENSASVMDDMVATVTVSPLACQRPYTIAAQGLDGGEVLGPLFRQETVTASMCPTTTVVISSTSVVDPAMLPTLTVLPTSTADLTPTDGGTGGQTEDDDDNSGAIIGGVIGGILAAIILIILIILIVYCCMKHREKSSRPVSPGDRVAFRPASGSGAGSGVKVQTLDRYGKPVPLEGDTTDTGVELTGYAAKSPEFTVTSGPSSTFQGNEYQSVHSDEKNRTPSAYMPEGSYDTLAPADEPTAPSAQVVPPAQNGQSNPNAPKLNYADLEQFTRKPASVKKPDPQPASQYAVIDPKSLQQGTYT